jgi:cytochrome c-type biogenesis protein CcmF
MVNAATFRVIVSPMVSWIWIGAIITILGALFAVWPARTSRRRKAS